MEPECNASNMKSMPNMAPLELKERKKERKKERTNTQTWSGVLQATCN